MFGCVERGVEDRVSYSMLVSRAVLLLLSLISWS